MVAPVSMKLMARPSVEPVTLDEAKSHLRVDHTDDDAQIERLIIAARMFAEGYTHQRIVRQKWRLYFNRFYDVFDLKPSYAREVIQVQYLDTDGATQTATSTLYTVDIAGQKVRRGYSQVWPATYAYENCVWIDTWVGMYDETASPVSDTLYVGEDIKHAIMMMVSEMYENTEVNYSTPMTPSPAFEMLLQPYWIPNG